MLCWNRLFAVSILALPGLIVWQRALSSFNRWRTLALNDYIKRLCEIHCMMGWEREMGTKTVTASFTLHVNWCGRNLLDTAQNPRDVSQVRLSSECPALFCLQKCSNIKILAIFILWSVTDNWLILKFHKLLSKDFI